MMDEIPLSPPVNNNINTSNNNIEEEIRSSPQVSRRSPPVDSPPLSPSSLSSPSSPSLETNHTYNDDIDPALGNYTNITIAFPSVPLPFITHLWQTFLIYLRLKIIPLLLKRSIIVYIFLFLLLQFSLVIFYQHQYNNHSSGYKRERVESDLETFAKERKDESNTTTVVFVDVNNKDWVHNFLYDLKKLKMMNYMIFARDKQVHL